MSNETIILRANENSSLYNTIKARNSKQNVFDYREEANACPFVKKTEIATPQSSMNNQNQQTLKIPLANHGLLYDLYLKTKFSTPGADGTNHTDAGHGTALTNWAGAWSWTKCRLVYQGTTLFEWTPEWIMCSQYTRATKEKSLQLDHMMGGSILGVENNTATALVGRRAAATSAGGIHLLAPLKAFFSDGLGRVLDLYSLNSTVFLEIDYRANDQAHEVLETATNFCGYDGCEAICKLIELSPQELSAYQARNYVPGSVSSQLGFTTTHFQEAVASPVLITGSSQVGNKIKLNSISGLVRRLFVYSTLDADTTAKKYFIPTKLSRVRLLANNSVIHEQLETSSGDVNSTSNGYRGDIAMEAYSNNLPMSYGGVVAGAFDPMAAGKGSDGAAGVPAPIADGETDMSRVVVINFALNPDDYSSADGLVSFSQVSGGGPILECFFDSSASSNPHTIHVVAEIASITTYNTSNSGSISIKTITE